MKTIQMTIDEALLTSVDRVIASLGTTRSSFIREALQLALQRQQILAMEQQHAAAYQVQPSTREENEGWDAIRSWGKQ